MNLKSSSYIMTPLTVKNQNEGDQNMKTSITQRINEVNERKYSIGSNVHFIQNCSYADRVAYFKRNTNDEKCAFFQNILKQTKKYFDQFFDHEELNKMTIRLTLILNPDATMLFSVMTASIHDKKLQKGYSIIGITELIETKK